MPMALPLLAAGFLAAGTVATAIGLGTALVIAGTAISWAAVLTVTGAALMAISALTMKTPKPGSTGGQLDLKTDTKAPIPVAYGRTATGGFLTYRETYGKKNANLALVAILSAGPIAGVEAHYANDARVYYAGDPSSSPAIAIGIGDGSKLYRNKLRTRFQTGEAPAVQTITSAIGLPLPGSPGKLSALAHVIQNLEYNTDAFPQGLPKNLYTLRGVKLYDPRKDSTYPGGSGAHRRANPASWDFSENPYLAALDWTLGRWWNGKKQYGIGALWAEVDVAAFVNGANIADANGWRVGGVVVTSDDKFAVLGTLLQAGGGLPVARGAQISTMVNAPKASVFTLNSSDIIGEIEIMNSTTWRDRSNTIVPTYREESQLWQLIAGQQVSSSVYVDEDGGERKTIEAEYPLVQQAAQAHQLATYELCNSREFLTFNVTCKVRALNVRVGEALTVNIPEVAAVSKKCIVAAREFNPADLTVTLSLKSESDAKHAFALGQSQVAPPAPALNGYNPSAPGAPASTAWAVTGTEITNPADQTKVPTIVVTGETDDPNASQVIVEYRPTGSTTWIDYGEYPRTTRKIEITNVTAQTSYDIAISYRTVRGVLSDRLELRATAGAMTIAYAGGVLLGTPTKLGDVNSSEGSKLGGIAPGADVTGNNTAKDTNAVGGIPASTVTGALKDRNGNVVNIQATIDAATAAQQPLIDAAKKAGDDANVKIDSADSVLNKSIAAAKKAGDDADAKGANAQSRVATLESVIDTPDTGLKARVSTIEKSFAGGNSNEALAQRTSDLETTINTPTTGVKARLTTVETAYSDPTTGLARRTTDLETSLNTTTTGVKARLSSAESVLSNPTSGLVKKTDDLTVNYKPTGNLIGNSALLTLDGWTYSEVAGGGSMVLNRAGSSYMLGGVENNLTLWQPNDKGDGLYGEAWSPSFAVTPGSTLQFYAYAMSHRAKHWVSLMWLKGDGTTTAEYYAGEFMGSRFNEGGQNPNAWEITGSKAVIVPPSAVAAKLMVRQYGDTRQADRYCWFTRPFVGEVAPGCKTWVAYTPGDNRAQLAGTNAKLTTVQTVLGDANGGIVKRTTDLETTYNAPSTGVNARLASTETAISNPTTGLVKRTTDLETTINTANTGLSARVGKAETAITQNNSALANRSTLLEAAVAGASGTLNPNPDFSAWSNPAAEPDNWTYWGQAEALGRVANPLARGGYAVDHTPTWLNSGLTRGSIYVVNGWYVMEATVWKLSGSWVHSGVTLHGQVHINFATDIDTAGRTGDNNGDGGVRSWSKMVQIRDDLIGPGYKNWHLMGNWDGFGSTHIPKSLRWMRCAIRPATDAEVKAMKADATLNNPGGALARIATVESATTDGRFAAATRVTTLEAQGVGGLNVNGNFNVAGYAGGVPHGWADWINGGRSVVSNQPGRNGTIPVQMRRNGVENVGIQTTIYNLAAGYYVLECDVQCFGNWQGAGMHINNLNGSAYNISFGSAPDINEFVFAGNAYNRRSWSVMVKMEQQADALFYAMSGWSGFGLDGSHADVHWHKCLIRPATDGEIKAKKALADVGGVAARVTTSEGAITNLQGRTAAYWSTTAVANGNRAQLTIRADQGGGGVDIIGDVSISGNLLVSGSVQTRNIAEGAVNDLLAMQRYYSEYGTEWNQWSPFEGASGVLQNPTGKPVRVDIYVAEAPTNYASCSFKVVRRNIHGHRDLTDWFYSGMTRVFIDWPDAGTPATYVLLISNDSDGSNGYLRIAEQTMVITEIKR